MLQDRVQKQGEMQRRGRCLHAMGPRLRKPWPCDMHGQALAWHPEALGAARATPLAAAEAPGGVLDARALRGGG